MSLEALVGEIRSRTERDLAAIEERRAAELDRIAAERDHGVREIQDRSARATAGEVQRERTQRIAAAKLKARQLLYEAREGRLADAIGETRRLLADYTASPEYARVLELMVSAATPELGGKVRVSGRPEDAARLKSIAGASFDPTPRAILGGVIVESADGHRRLNLSFDELLRLREDRVRDLLA